MMTIRTFEAINGHVPAIARTRLGYRASCVCKCGRYAARIESDGWFATESRALEALRNEVLRVHGEIAMERDGWACARCSAVTSIQAHHREFRSHGRDDRVPNLTTRCVGCHEAEHRRKA